MFATMEHSMKGLTRKQEEVLDFITTQTKQAGVGPSYREIGKKFGLRSSATVALHIRALIRKGYLEHRKWMARGLLPKSLGISVPGTTTPIPLLSSFASAGPTQEIMEDVERIIHMDRYLLRSKDCFAMRVKGVSMIGAGIEEGDIVIVRRQQTADHRSLVLALKDGEATIKRYMLQKDGVLLKAENPQSQSYFAPYNSDDQSVRGIVGKVVKIIKDAK